MSDVSLIDQINNDYTKQELTNRVEIHNLLRDFFKDSKKVDLWYKTENPLLGNIKPVEMIKQGRSDKLLKFIQTSLSENKRD